MFTPDDYVAAIDRMLTASGLSRMTAERILAEQSDLLRDLAEGGSSLEEELGAPADYAALLSEELDEQPQRKSSFSRFSTRPFGALTREGRSHLWDPQDPSILQPHLFGFGWSINWGAVAVRLGWIRPDDVDADVLGAIPSPVLKTAQGLPIALAAGHLLALSATYGKLPERVHSGWDAVGKPKKATRPRVYLALPALAEAATAGAALIPAARGDREDSLRAASLATVVCAVAPSMLIGNLAELGRMPNPGALSAIAAVAGIAGSLGVVVLPLRSGLTAIWKKEGVV